MKGRLLLFGLLYHIIGVKGQDYCNETISCPESSPCCNQYGTCGSGVDCLGGCDPRYSYSIDACVAMPTCRNLSSYNLTDNWNRMANRETYLGNSTGYDFTYTGQLLNLTSGSSDNAVLMTMPQYSSGAVISSTFYVWYGNIKYRMKTSRYAGVVTAAIMWSDVHDEIDYEFIGADLETAQTNYYYHGIEDWINGMNITLDDTFESYHTYEVDWTQDSIKWLVDGQVGRTLYKNTTYNETLGTYKFPQTPARLQFSLWPGGNSTQPNGTIEWAGGLIDWDNSDIQDYGYDYATLQSIDITCYDAPTDTISNGSNSYLYMSGAANNTFNQSAIMISDVDTILSSNEASGLNKTYGETTTTTTSTSTSTSTNTKSKSKSQSTSSTLSGDSTGFVQNAAASSSSSSSQQSTSESTSSSRSTPQDLSWAVLALALIGLTITMYA